MSFPLAIQSWCFRAFKPLDDFLVQLKLAGVNATELCAVHANFMDVPSASTISQKFKDAGVSIVAMGVENLTGDDAKDRPRFEWAKAAGVKHMSVTFSPDAMFTKMKNVEKLADEFDLRLGIHNHGGYDWLGNTTILKHVFANTGKRIGLYIDTAWALDAGQDPIKMVETFGDRLTGVHVKDFIFERSGKEVDVIIGTGNLDLPKFMSTLKQVNFDGPIVIEYEGDEKNPVPALKECVQKIAPLL